MRRLVDGSCSIQSGESKTHRFVEICSAFNSKIKGLLVNLSKKRGLTLYESHLEESLEYFLNVYGVSITKTLKDSGKSWGQNGNQPNQGKS